MNKQITELKLTINRNNAELAYFRFRYQGVASYEAIAYCNLRIYEYESLGYDFDDYCERDDVAIGKSHFLSDLKRLTNQLRKGLSRFPNK